LTVCRCRRGIEHQKSHDQNFTVWLPVRPCAFMNGATFCGQGSPVRVTITSARERAEIDRMSSRPASGRAKDHSSWRSLIRRLRSGTGSGGFDGKRWRIRSPPHPSSARGETTYLQIRDNAVGRESERVKGKNSAGKNLRSWVSLKMWRRVYLAKWRRKAASKANCSTT
jgi:hypothetical protein